MLNLSCFLFLNEIIFVVIHMNQGNLIASPVCLESLLRVNVLVLSCNGCCHTSVRNLKH